MDFINDFVTSVQQNSDFLGFIGILLTAILSIYTFKGETSAPFIRERYDNLIFPLFDLVEPFLFQKCPEYIFEKALCIIEENKSLADGKLLDILYHCKCKKTPENFRSLCVYIDRNYDKFCRHLGLKKRGVFYRISRGQYRSMGYIVFYAVLCTLLGFAIACAFSLMVLVSVSLLCAFYEVADSSGKLFILLLVILSGLAIAKYVNKHF